MHTTIESHTMPRHPLANIRWGAGIGASFGAVYAVWAVVLYAFGGGRAFTDGRTSLLGAAAFYMIGGTVAGGIIGLSRPLLLRRSGAVVVGVVACVPLAIGLRLMFVGFTPWALKDTLFVVIWPLVFGSASSLALYHVLASPHKKR
jgi:hypothetical protein